MAYNPTLATLQRKMRSTTRDPRTAKVRGEVLAALMEHGDYAGVAAQFGRTVDWASRAITHALWSAHRAAKKIERKG